MPRAKDINLQRLGAQVNIDMPWNPSRLEQRKGRIQRIGQTRDNVHVLSLRYADTVEDEVYAALSHRFGDIFAVLGQLRTPSRMTGSQRSSRTAPPSGTSPSASTRPSRRWSCATSATSPMTSGLDWE